MKFSYSLIKKLLPDPPPLAKLAASLNTHSFEVEEAAGDMLDVKIPANQYSAMASHIGIAREIAIEFNLSFKDPVRAARTVPGKGLVSVAVSEKERCPRYTARVFDLKKPVGVSPAWMQKVLRSCGVNPINAIVDLANYVMLETGQPLHVFDAEKIAAGGKRKTTREIVVRRAHKGERIETLDGKNVDLDPSILLIADAKEPLAIAGIKGGMSSGVTKGTKRIVLEAANFDGKEIYQTMQKLNLRTDAGIRFSHGISPALIDWGVGRFAELLADEGAKTLDAAEFSTVRPGDVTLNFDPMLYKKRIGIPVSRNAAQAIFKKLGFDADSMAWKDKKAGLRVRVPAWRNDIARQEDLDEEIARFHGYGNIVPVAPAVHYLHAEDDPIVTLKDRARKILAGLGVSEIYTSSFLAEEEARTIAPRMDFLFGRPISAVRVTNPVAEDRPYLRPSLCPGIRNAVAGNTRFMDTVACFETGKVLGAAHGVVYERASLGIVWAAKQEPKAVRYLRGVVEQFLSGMGIDDAVMIAEKREIRIQSGSDIVGKIMIETPARHWFAAYAELSLEALLEIAEERRAFRGLPKFPAVMRNISLLLPYDARIGEVSDAIAGANDLIEIVDLVDEYQDEKLRGRQSLTFRIVFQADDRTLTDDEVNRAMEKIAMELKKKFSAEVR